MTKQTPFWTDRLRQHKIDPLDLPKLIGSSRVIFAEKKTCMMRQD